MSKMTPNELVSIIRAHRRDSLGYEDGDLSQQRAEAMDHYHGRPYGNEVVGRSQVVSRDLAETVDWAMPVLMRTFVQCGNIAEFDPVGEEDEPQAQQESDYMHQVLMKDNGGVMFIHDTLKEALLLKNCYGKHWWATEDTVRREGVTGLTMDEITKMITDLEAGGAEVEIVGKARKFVPMPGLPMMPMFADAVAKQEDESVPPPPGMLEVFDIRLKVKRQAKRVRVEAVPVEEVRVSKKCRGSLQSSPFVEHVTKKTRSELIEMGMPRDWVNSLPAYASDENSVEVNARNSVTDETDSIESGVNDRSMDEIEFAEAYVRVDYDNDGVAELRKVVTCADKIPPGDEWNEEIEACAITGGVIKRVPHRHIGESLDDELADLQEIMTMLKRQLNDNIYLTNNSRQAANDRVNLKDLMTSTPGGVVRVKGSDPIAGSVEPLVVRPIIGEVLPVLDFYNKSKESRSGIRPGSDMDPDILRETTKGAFLEHLNRASQKIELIARLYAETFLKEIILQTHGLTVRHQDKARKVQLRGKWVPVNPMEWKERTDLTVRVGLGTGNEEEKRQKLGMLSQMQGQLLQAAAGAPPPVYEKMYALFADMCESMGFLPEKYAIAPDSDEYKKMQADKPQDQMPPEVMVEKMKIEATGQMKMQEMQHKGQISQLQMQQDAQLAQMKAQYQAMVDQNRQQVEAQQQQARLSMERELEEYRAQLKAMLESQAAEMKQQTAIAIARINAESRLDAAQLTAQTTLTPEQETASDVAVLDGDMPAEPMEQAEPMPVQPQGPDTSAMLVESLNAFREALAVMNANMSRSRRIVRGPDGRAEGIE